MNWNELLQQCPQEITLTKPLEVDIHFTKNGKEYSTDELVKEHKILEILKKHKLLNYVIKNKKCAEMYNLSDEEVNLLKDWLERI